EAHHRPHPRRLRRVLELERRDRAAARRRSSGHRVGRAAARGRLGRRRPHRSHPQHRRPGRPRRALLRRCRDHERPRGCRPDHRAGVRRRLRAQPRRELRRRVGPRPRRHARADPRVRLARRRRARHLHRAGQVPPPVLRGPARRRVAAHGRDAAPDRGVRAGRAVARAGAAVALCAELVHLRQRGPEHPRRRAPDHGRPRLGEAHGRDRRRLARRGHVARLRDRRAHPRGGQRRRARGSL
ncbi:MAG: hypothetical protein AVDCRST_MAG85-4192, partial [uncultured Solirubrobacteraceae bacterium]